MSQQAYFHAINRFGLGASAADSATNIGADAKQWLIAQLENPKYPDKIKPYQNDSAAYQDFMLVRKQKDMPQSERQAALMQERKQMRQYYIGGVLDRFQQQQTTDQPLIERLVMFWSNHFSIYMAKPPLQGVVHRYEAEAIRPYVTGKFADMLLAVEKHPAMLVYLDNAQSIGPDSIGGQRNKKGLNENLAREILELHTMGVNGGYTQTDVRELARLITGWSFDHAGEVPSPDFRFYPARHERGDKTLLGKRYSAGGVKEGEQALRDIAAHSATAQFIATKLVRHFVDDNPPAEMVQDIASVFTRTDGDLKEVMKAVIAHPMSWQTPMNKVRTAYEFVLSAARLTNAPFKPQQLQASLASLGYVVHGYEAPTVYPDVADYWASPDGLSKRIEWAYLFAKRVGSDIDPIALAEKSYGPHLHGQTRFMIANAPSKEEGLALLLASPEFQRR